MMKCKNCIRYELELKALKEQMEMVQYELAQYKMERYPKKKDRDKDDQDGEGPPKKKGGLFGHRGWFRKKPKKPNRVEEVKLISCPHCQSHDLSEYKDKVDEHIQEDIILPQKETVLYRKHLYYCKNCKKVLMGKGQEELPNSYIGPVAKTLAVFLKFNVKISDRDIQKMFKQLFHLKIVHSSMVGFRSQLKRHALPLYEKLIQTLKGGKFIHADPKGL